MPLLPYPLRAALPALALLLAALPAAVSVVAQSTPTAAGQGQGIEIANMDLAVSPGEDFYAFANGGWLAQTEIPADRSSIGVFVELRDEATRRQIALLDGAADAAPGSDEAKAVALFAQGMDLEQRNRQGIEPIRDALDRIALFEPPLREADWPSVRATIQRMEQHEAAGHVGVVEGEVRCDRPAPGMAHHHCVFEPKLAHAFGQDRSLA